MGSPDREQHTGRHSPISGVREVADRYDAFLVDSYGVLQDGRALYPESVECLEMLRSIGRAVIILTNTPRRMETVGREIGRIGITSRHYDYLVSAGELTFRTLLVDSRRFGISPGDAVYYVGPPRSRELLEGLPFTESGSIEAATFLLIAGLFAGMDEVDEYDALLQAAVAKGLPAVCANPDLVAVRAGIRGSCGGTIAARYQKLGGTVHYLGKPFPDIYEMALMKLPDTPRSRVLCIGDALDTDIGGAQNAGLDSLFISGGIHCQEIAACPSPDALGHLFHTRQRVPTLTTDSLRW